MHHHTLVLSVARTNSRVPTKSTGETPLFLTTAKSAERPHTHAPFRENNDSRDKRCTAPVIALRSCIQSSPSLLVPVPLSADPPLPPQCHGPYFVLNPPRFWGHWDHGLTSQLRSTVWRRKLMHTLTASFDEKQVVNPLYRQIRSRHCGPRKEVIYKGSSPFDLQDNFNIKQHHTWRKTERIFQGQSKPKFDAKKSAPAKFESRTATQHNRKA